MGNTTGQGHKGISHPFGAKHDATPWREPRLEERMWPNFINDLAAKNSAFAEAVLKDRTVDAIEEDVRNLGRKLTAHDDKYHYGWKPYEPDLDTSVPYCSVAVRPLDGGSGIYNWGPLPNGDHVEHQQIICSDGENFGITWQAGESFFVEPAERLHEYLVSPVRYRKDIITQAKKEIDEEWRQKANNNLNSSTLTGSYDQMKYNWFTYHCQDDVRAVLQRALQNAEKSGVQLLVY